MKKLIPLLLALLLLCTVTGCSKDKKEEDSSTKTFTNGALSIELPRAFEEKKDTDGLIFYTNEEIDVFMIPYSKSELKDRGYGEDLSLTAFSNLLISGRELLTQSETDAYNYYTYAAEAGENTYYYFLATYTSTDNFGAVYFVCNYNNYAPFTGTFPEWANKVTLQ